MGGGPPPRTLGDEDALAVVADSAPDGEVDGMEGGAEDAGREEGAAPALQMTPTPATPTATGCNSDCGGGCAVGFCHSDSDECSICQSPLFNFDTLNGKCPPSDKKVHTLPRCRHR